MKSEVIENRYFIECTCESADHLLVFDFFHWTDEKWDLEAYFTSNYHHGFFTRMKIAFNYLFKKNKFACLSDSIVIDEKNIHQLEQVIERIKIVYEENK